MIALTNDKLFYLSESVLSIVNGAVLINGNIPAIPVAMFLLIPPILGNKSKVKKITVVFIVAISLLSIIAYSSGNWLVTDYREKIGNERLDNQEEIKEFEESNTFSFTIDFNDIMFSQYSVQQIKENSDLFKNQIIKKLREVNEYNSDNINKEDYKLYEDYIKDADQCERMYIYIVNSNFFEGNIEERVYYLVKGIRSRISANNISKEPTNQKLIAIRYIDFGREELSVNNTEEAKIKFITSIQWSFKALNTLYNGDIDKPEEKYGIIKNIITGYKNIKMTSDKDSEEYQKAELLEEIFVDIQGELE